MMSEANLAPHGHFEVRRPCEHGSASAPQFSISAPQPQGAEPEICVGRVHTAYASAPQLAPHRLRTNLPPTGGERLVPHGVRRPC